MITLHKSIISGVALLLLSNIVLFAKDTNVDINPVKIVFATQATGDISSPVRVSITNYGYTSGLILGEATLEFSLRKDFNITNDDCNKSLDINSSCSIDVQFMPKSSGIKNILLNIPYGKGSDTLSVFLTNYEDVAQEAQRRLPPIMHDISIANEMNASSIEEFSWTAMGYDKGYDTYMVMFDCTGISDDKCGSNYANAEKFYMAGPLYQNEKTISEWTYGDKSSSYFKYIHNFNVPATRADGSNWDTGGTKVVIRFYAKSLKDDFSGLPSLSLLLPGGLSGKYHDTSGRSIQKVICPANGCSKGI